MPTLCIIAARSQSKGLPGKNMKPFHDHPLMVHSIMQAKKSQAFDVIAFTSDDEHYLKTAEDAGADVLINRPPELANDLAAKPPVLAHALDFAESQTGKNFDIVCDLQPTSPLRRSVDIEGAISHLRANDKFNNVISVCEAKDSPYYTLVECGADGALTLVKNRPDKFARRQDLPVVYALNGSIYAWRRSAIIEQLPSLTERTGMWVMSEECGVDIDTLLDFEIAEFVFGKYFKNSD